MHLIHRSGSLDHRAPVIIVNKQTLLNEACKVAVTVGNIKDFMFQASIDVQGDLKLEVVEQVVDVVLKLWSCVYLK